MIHRESGCRIKDERKVKEEKDIRSTEEIVRKKKKEEKRFSAGVYEILRTPVAGEEGKK